MNEPVSVKRFGQEMEEALQGVWDGLTPEQRLAAAWWLGHRVSEHLHEPASFRTLIYRRFGFGPEAYVPLQLAGWLDVSNAFHEAVARTACSTDPSLATSAPPPP